MFPTATEMKSTLPAELRALLDAHDATSFEASLDALFAERQKDLFRALGHLTRDLHRSVASLAEDPGATGSAPDARQRLHEALAMSANAAHESLAMAERLRPRADQLRDRAQALVAGDVIDPLQTRELAREVSRFSAACQEDFTRLVEQQSWQDLSGQRLQKVLAFIDRVEFALLELARITGTIRGASLANDAAAAPVSTQDEVDRLLSDFGF